MVLLSEEKGGTKSRFLYIIRDMASLYNKIRKVQKTQNLVPEEKGGTNSTSLYSIADMASFDKRDEN